MVKHDAEGRVDAKWLTLNVSDEVQHLVEAIRNDDGVQKALEPLREWESKDTDEKLFENHVTAALNACGGVLGSIGEETHVAHSRGRYIMRTDKRDEELDKPDIVVTPTENNSISNVLHAVEADATADENGLYAPADSTEKGVVVVDHGNARRGANYRQAGGPVYTADVPMAERLKITVTDRSSFEEGKLDDVRSATELFQPHTAVAVYAVYYKYQQAQTNLGKQEEKLDRSVPPVGAELALTMTRLEQAKASKKTQRRSMYRYHTL